MLRRDAVCVKLNMHLRAHMGTQRVTRGFIALEKSLSKNKKRLGQGGRYDKI